MASRLRLRQSMRCPSRSASHSSNSAVSAVRHCAGRWMVPGWQRGRAIAVVLAGITVASKPGIVAVLVVTLLQLTGHQAIYTYVAPFALRSGFGRTSLVLLVFGSATVAGIWVTGLLADRYLRPVLLAALTMIAVAMLILGLAARDPAALLAAVALWGAAFGGTPTLLQTALVDASGPASADVATSLQTTVYNIGIAAGSLAGGLVLSGVGAAALPWVRLAFIAVALSTVATARQHAFPRDRAQFAAPDDTSALAEGRCQSGAA